MEVLGLAAAAPWAAGDCLRMALLRHRRVENRDRRSADPGRGEPEHRPMALTWIRRLQWPIGGERPGHQRRSHVCHYQRQVGPDPSRRQHQREPCARPPWAYTLPCRRLRWHSHAMAAIEVVLGDITARDVDVIVTA